MVVAVYDCEFTQRRLETVYVRDTLQSLEPIPHRFDDSEWPWTMEWRPLPGPPTLVSAPPGCTWSRFNGRLFLLHPRVGHLDGFGVRCCGHSRIWGFTPAADGAKPATPSKVVSRYVPAHHAKMFDGMRTDTPATPPPAREAQPPPPQPPPPMPEPEPVADREPVPAGFLF